MRCVHNRTFLLMIMIGLSYNAWSQAAAGGAAGGVREAAPPSASITMMRRPRRALRSPMRRRRRPIRRSPSTGKPFAYTARAGYLPLRNATTGQAEAHLFFTYYAKEGVGDVPARPLIFFLGGAPGVAAAWQEFGGLGPKRMKWAATARPDSRPTAGRTIPTPCSARPIWSS